MGYIGFWPFFNMKSSILCTPHTQIRSGMLVIFGLKGTNRSNRKDKCLHRIMHERGKKTKAVTASLREHVIPQKMPLRQAFSLEMYM